MAYSFSSISAKNYQNQLMCVIVCYISVVFLRHSVVQHEDGDESLQCMVPAFIAAQRLIVSL